MREQGRLTTTRRSSKQTSEFPAHIPARTFLQHFVLQHFVLTMSDKMTGSVKDIDLDTQFKRKVEVIEVNKDDLSIDLIAEDCEGDKWSPYT